MHSLRNAAYLLFPLSIGTYAYSNYLHTHKKHKAHADTSHFSEPVLNFIKQHHLVVPDFYHKLKKDSSTNSFFFKSILKNVGGLDEFSIYLDEDLEHLANCSKKCTKAERQDLFDHSKLYCMFVANKKVEDFEEVVHAGFTATLLDNMGATLAFLACENKPVATTSMRVNYRKPIKTGEEYLTELSTKKLDEDRVAIQGVIKDKEGTVYADADFMFVKVDWKRMVISNFIKNFEEKVLGMSIGEFNETLPMHLYMHIPDIIIDLQTNPKRKIKMGESYARFC